MSRTLLTTVVILSTAIFSTGCHRDTYGFHHGGHGHYDVGVDRDHFEQHYGSFSDGYGPLGFQR